MAIRDDWQAINWELHRLCAELLRRLEPRLVGDVVAQIGHAFLGKGTRTLQAVNVLYDHDLAEQAQVLVRVLLELRFSFDCFLRMVATDPRGACERVVDSMWLEKMKQQRASNFAGLDLIPGAPSRAELEAEEQEIVRRYPGDELERIRRHGFTGLPVEQRAQLTGHQGVYNIVYRNFSRNVHSTDYLENFLHQPLGRGTEPEGYREERDRVSLYAAHFSAGGIAESSNAIFGGGLEKELDALGLKQRVLRQRGRKAPNSNSTAGSRPRAKKRPSKK